MLQIKHWLQTRGGGSQNHLSFVLKIYRYAPVDVGLNLPQPPIRIEGVAHDCSWGKKTYWKAIHYGGQSRWMRWMPRHPLI